jgi:segregation and condensation protein B
MRHVGLSIAQLAAFSVDDSDASSEAESPDEDGNFMDVDEDSGAERSRPDEEDISMDQQAPFVNIEYDSDAEDLDNADAVDDVEAHQVAPGREEMGDVLEDDDDDAASSDGWEDGSDGEDIEGDEDTEDLEEDEADTAAGNAVRDEDDDDEEYADEDEGYAPL